MTGASQLVAFPVEDTKSAVAAVPVAETRDVEAMRQSNGSARNVSSRHDISSAIADLTRLVTHRFDRIDTVLGLLSDRIATVETALSAIPSHALSHNGA